MFFVFLPFYFNFYIFNKQLHTIIYISLIIFRII